MKVKPALQDWFVPPVPNLPTYRSFLEDWARSGQLQQSSDPAILKLHSNGLSGSTTKVADDHVRRLLDEVVGLCSWYGVSDRLFADRTACIFATAIAEQLYLLRKYNYPGQWLGRAGSTMDPRSKIAAADTFLRGAFVRVAGSHVSSDWYFERIPKQVEDLRKSSVGDTLKRTSPAQIQGWLTYPDDRATDRAWMKLLNAGDEQRATLLCSIFNGLSKELAVPENANRSKSYQLVRADLIRKTVDLNPALNSAVTRELRRWDSKSLLSKARTDLNIHRPGEEIPFSFFAVPKPSAYLTDNAKGCVYGGYGMNIILVEESLANAIVDSHVDAQLKSEGIATGVHEYVHAQRHLDLTHDAVGRVFAEKLAEAVSGTKSYPVIEHSLDRAGALAGVNIDRVLIGAAQAPHPRDNVSQAIAENMGMNYLLRVAFAGALYPASESIAVLGFVNPALQMRDNEKNEVEVLRHFERIAYERAVFMEGVAAVRQRAPETVAHVLGEQPFGSLALTLG